MRKKVSGFEFLIFPYPVMDISPPHLESAFIKGVTLLFEIAVDTSSIQWKNG
ncbi:hypothetical protein SAMN06264849_101455 [Melghirimyces algeriensis]|uniref:Uncharacterized protein n=1 Tax=Melghirimyces algeriensis TaxID=910412 RepID=A0A521B0X3_9BACL|nr:hypothetical protein SAMN06264849_101455 [Melghirimyces algeriensis]